VWLVSFMDYDLGYIDLEEKTLQPLNVFGPYKLEMVAANGFEPSTSWSRTRLSKFIMPCR